MSWIQFFLKTYFWGVQYNQSLNQVHHHYHHYYNIKTNQDKLTNKSHVKEETLNLLNTNFMFSDSIPQIGIIFASS